ncbi:transposase [Nocardia sp. NPDC004068]|uniref:transposase n=1 Tax=Nocardia sp. NPDC004068 TaxID=3364303 RepID=UPI0036BF994C
MNSIRRYGPVSDEVRRAAVAAARALMDGANWSRTRAAREVAAGLSVHPNTVSNWLRDAEPAEPCGTVAELQEQVRSLQDQLRASHITMRELERHQPTDGRAR